MSCLVIFIMDDFLGRESIFLGRDIGVYNEKIYDFFFIVYRSRIKGILLPNDTFIVVHDYGTMLPDGSLSIIPNDFTEISEAEYKRLTTN